MSKTITHSTKLINQCVLITCKNLFICTKSDLWVDEMNNFDCCVEIHFVIRRKRLLLHEYHYLKEEELLQTCFCSVAALSDGHSWKTPEERHFHPHFGAPAASFNLLSYLSFDWFEIML